MSDVVPKLPHFQDLPGRAFPSLVRLCPASWCVYLRGSLISAFLTLESTLETGNILARVLEPLEFSVSSAFLAAQAAEYK